MNEHLRDRVLRKLDALSDERGYQLLDYIEFLESKYAERQAPPASIFTRFSEAVEDRLRAGKVSATTIAETVSLMNRAFNALNGVATGVAAAGRSVANDLATATRSSGGTAAPSGGRGSGGVAGPGPSPSPGSGATGGSGAGAPVADMSPTGAPHPGPGPAEAPAPEPIDMDPSATESGELDPPVGG
jgi:hypothetical protein